MHTFEKSAAAHSTAKSSAENFSVALHMALGLYTSTLLPMPMLMMRSNNKSKYHTNMSLNLMFSAA